MEEMHPWYRGFVGTVTPKAGKEIDHPFPSSGFAVDFCVGVVQERTGGAIS